jgi:hypothetical protein
MAEQSRSCREGSAGIVQHGGENKRDRRTIADVVTEWLLVALAVPLLVAQIGLALQ